MLCYDVMLRTVTPLLYSLSSLT